MSVMFKIAFTLFYIINTSELDILNYLISSSYIYNGYFIKGVFLIYIHGLFIFLDSYLIV
jgi:hypothetical protein